MDKIAKQCGITIPAEDPDLEVFCFPTPTDEGDSYLDWTGIEIDPDARDDPGVLKYVDFRTGAAIDYDDMEETMHDQLYDGHRDLLVPMLRRGWDRFGESFRPIPTTARWTIQSVEGELMPVLKDDDHYYLLCPTSAKQFSGTLTMPTPAEAQDAPPANYAHDVWFEDCGDGGAYVLALDDDTVVVFYIDGPGDMIYGRWQCSKHQWEEMWMAAFGAATVDLCVCRLGCRWGMP